MAGRSDTTVVDAGAGAVRRCVAVTGGTGFIGSAISAMLRQHGYPVITISRSSRRSPDVVDDLSDAERLQRVLMTHEVAAVVHCAWEGDPRSAQFNFASQVNANVVPALHLGIAAGLAGVDKVVVLSSGGGLVRQEGAPLPAYGFAKLQVENALRTSASIFGFQYVALRPTAVYGPAQNPQRPVGAIGVFAHRILDGRPIEVFGGIDRERDFLHVADLADLVLLAVERDFNGVLEAGGPELLSLREVIALLSDAAGVTPHIEVRPGDGVDPVSIRLDNSAAQAAFGWIPRRRLAQEAPGLIAAMRSSERLEDG